MLTNWLNRLFGSSGKGPPLPRPLPAPRPRFKPASSLRCVVCGRTLKRVWDDSLDTDPPHQNAWDDAGVHLLAVGYGSKHDCTQFYIGVCDPCIDAAKADGRLVVAYDPFE